MFDPLARHCCICRRASSSIHSPMGWIRPLSSADRDELFRCNQAKLRACPAGQPQPPTRCQWSDRPVVDSSDAAHRAQSLCGGDFSGKSVPVLTRSAHGVETIAAPSCGFGTIHGGVGIAQQSDLILIPWIKANTDSTADRKTHAARS